MKTFADRLRHARIAAGLTQEQLGFAVDITKSSVSAWENGRETPSFKTLPQLRAALGCSLDYLVCGDSAEIGTRDSSPEYKTADTTTRNQGEQRLLAMFRVLNTRRRKALLDLLEQQQ